MVAWATPNDVFKWTRAVVSEDDIAVAQGTIDLFSGVDSDEVDVTLIWPKDLKLLLKATCYQAKWETRQIDVQGRQDVKGVSQDGVNATYATRTGAVLAPLAQMSIERLSWKRPRALRASRRRSQGVLELANTWPRDAEGGGPASWSPMGGL